jgi:hypothetical protein
MPIVQKRRLSPHPRRTVELLTLLGSSPHGATEALLVRAYGFTCDMITDLVHAGLATAEREAMNAGAAGPIEAVRFRITAAGRSAIEE